MSIIFKCIKCKKTAANIPLVVIRDNADDDFEASRVCWECLEYCRQHGLKLQTMEEYEEKKGIKLVDEIKRNLVIQEEQRGVK